MDNLDERIKNLENIIRPYTVPKKNVLFGFEDTFSSYKVYVGVVITILLLLLITRPSFLYTSETPTSKSKFSFQKLILTWFIISLILVLTIYTYHYKK